MGADVHAWVCTVIGFAGAVFHCGLCDAVLQFGLSALFSSCSLDVGHEGCVQGVSRSAGYVKGIVSYQSAFFVDATLLRLCGLCSVLAMRWQDWCVWLCVGQDGCVQGVSLSAGYVQGIVSYQSAFYVDATLLSLCGLCSVLAMRWQDWCVLLCWPRWMCPKS